MRHILLAIKICEIHHEFATQLLNVCQSILINMIFTKKTNYYLLSRDQNELLLAYNTIYCKSSIVHHKLPKFMSTLKTQVFQYSRNTTMELPWTEFIYGLNFNLNSGNSSRAKSCFQRPGPVI